MRRYNPFYIKIPRYLGEQRSSGRIPNMLELKLKAKFESLSEDPDTEVDEKEETEELVDDEDEEEGEELE